MESTETKHSQAQQNTAQTMWQSMITSQLAQVESMLQRIDASLKSQLNRGKEQVTELNRLTTSAFTWAAELQQGAIDLALSTLKSANEAVSKVRA